MTLKFANPRLLIFAPIFSNAAVPDRLKTPSCTPQSTTDRITWNYCPIESELNVWYGVTENTYK